MSNKKKKPALKNTNFYEKTGYKVSIPYRRSINMEERNDLFWYNNSKIDPDKIVISLESSAYPFEESELKLILEIEFMNESLYSFLIS